MEAAILSLSKPQAASWATTLAILLTLPASTTLSQHWTLQLGRTFALLFATLAMSK